MRVSISMFWPRKVPLWQAHHCPEWPLPLEMIQHKPINANPPVYSTCYSGCRNMSSSSNISWQRHDSCWLSSFPSHRENLPIELQHNIQHIHFSSNKLNIVWGAVKQDPVPNTLCSFTLNGWPECSNQLLRIAWHLWGVWDELSIEDGVLLKEEHICIPPKLFDRTLANLHEGHQGVDKVQLLKHWCFVLTLIWTSLTMSEDSQSVQSTRQPSWYSQYSPNMNSFTHKGGGYLLICDTFSKYPFINRVPTKTVHS